MKTVVYSITFITAILIACKHTPQDSETKPAQPLVNGQIPVPCDTFQVSYTRDIIPILSTHCYSCHSGQAPTAGLDVSTYTTVRNLALNDGHYLLNTVNGNPDYVYMPPTPAAKLSLCETTKIRVWITQGAHQN